MKLAFGDFDFEQFINSKSPNFSDSKSKSFA